MILRVSNILGFKKDKKNKRIVHSLFLDNFFRYQSRDNKSFFLNNFKEKNILLIHQAAATLPVGSTAGELNRLLISFLANDPSGDMHQLVSEVLSLEVKQII